MFPKKGNNFPNGIRTTNRDVSYTAAVAAALRAELGNSHQAVKSVMRWTGVNERTAKNWLAGTCGPRGEHLIELIRHSDRLLETILQLAGRGQTIAGTRLVQARNVLAEALQDIDACIADGKGAR
jgi:hypothetical protein